MILGVPKSSLVGHIIHGLISFVVWAIIHIFLSTAFFLLWAFSLGL